MDDAKLRTLLTDAFLPFAQGFAEKNPEQVTVNLTLTKRTIQGTVSYSAEDFDALLGDTFPRDEIGAAFRALSSWSDSRMPSLSIVGLNR